MSEQLDLDQDVFVRELIVVARRWRTRLDERLKSIGMSQARWAVLFWLDQSPEGLSQSALAELAGVEAPTLVRLIDLLEAQGLVERRVSERDRRSKLVRPTPAAASVIQETGAIANELRREIMADIGPDDLAATLRLLGQMRVTLGGEVMEREALAG